MPRTSRAGDGAADTATAEGTEPSVRLPFPSKPKTSVQAASVDARSKPAPADETAVEPPVKFPTLPGREEGPVAEEDTVEVKQPAVATAGRGANGASPARVAPRFDIKPRAAAESEAMRVSGLTAFLSGKSRRDGQRSFGPGRRRHTTAGRKAGASFRTGVRPGDPSDGCGVRSQVGRGRRDGLYTLFRRINRSPVAARDVAVRLNHGAARTYR